ncbi:MAG: Crp/Fnr family transcriptional regulator [Coriobacteriia bacterium]|nr:Crp/Fnr family transcriptional regulator [Coriobacteriia bacterium]
MVENSIISCSLFRDIEASSVDALINCLRATKRSYKKAEFVFHADSMASSVGIVESGSVNVIQEDYWGNRTILAHLKPGELFGEAYSCAPEQRLPVSVVATEDTSILLLDYRKIISSCPSSCAFHARLIANMLHIVASNNIRLTKKLEHVSKKTLREKLLSFLSSEAVHSSNSTITVPFDRQELAEYLCVDRSALSRELSSMKRDGIITYKKNHFTLLQ